MSNRFFIPAAARALVALCCVTPAEAAVTPGSALPAVRAAGFPAPLRAAVRPRGAVSTSLQDPQGLAIAPNGDLYVANFLGNTVTVYGSNLVQKTASTISAGLDYPTGVAFDSAGNLFVNNYTSAQVTVYNPSLQQLTSRTLNGYGGRGIAIDALDDVYIAGVLNTHAANGTGAIDIYRCDGSFENQFIEPGLNYPYFVAASKHFIAYGGVNVGQPSGVSAYYTYTQTQLASSSQQSAPGYAWAAHAVGAMAFDSNEKLYVAHSDTDTVGVFTPVKNTGANLIAQLGFSPTGIAVDLAHNHVFVADGAGNAIAVYTAAGSFVTTLH